MIKRACSKEQIELRKNEIVLAVKNMLEIMDYQDISMKTISEHISIARSSLYCYYNNKEEIMLDLLKNDYYTFLNKIINSFSNNDDINVLAENISQAYLTSIDLLKIVSIYLTDIEIHASLEKLIEFKSMFITLLPQLKQSIKLYFKNISEQNINNLFNSILMLTHSLYPMINPNDNQKIAMKKTGMKICSDQHQFTYDYILFILKACL